MVEFKRSKYLYLSIADEQLLDFEAFLQGELKFSATVGVQAFSVLTESTHPLTPQELELLALVPSDRWVEAQELRNTEAATDADVECLEQLATKGLVLSSTQNPTLDHLRKREELLRETQWSAKAACFHFVAKQINEIGTDDDDSQLDYERSAENFAQLVVKHGPPPPAFHRVAPRWPGAESIELPVSNEQGSLEQILGQRRTVRVFDSNKALDLGTLASILRSAFGCHGYAHLSEEVTVLKRTSPSGGSLHPIEIYPFLLNVEGAPIGIYHYDAFRHALTPLRAFERNEGQDFAVRALGGQSYARSTHALFFLTARFERNFWKYRQSIRTYSVILMDAGHLSQTFYLLCAQAGLGAYFSGAINAPLIEEILELDGISEGAIAMCGCGNLPSPVELDLDFRPFVPRQTEV